MSVIASRVRSISPSATSGMAAKANKLRSAGIDVISLSQGEPDFTTPKYISDGAKRAIDSGAYTSYPPTAGYADLREAIANKYHLENGVPYKAEQIVVCNGAKQALYHALSVLLEEGDEVIVLTPYWVSHVAQVKLLGAKPVLVKGKQTNDYEMDISAVRKVISKKTKAILFSSPNNPTGLVYSQEELSALAELLESHPQIFVVSDEIYEYINYSTRTRSFGAIPGMLDRTITINGFSKSYAMTGWRVGYLAAPEWLAREITKLQGHVSSANCSIAQRAALEAINQSQNAVREMVASYKKRRDFVFRRLNEMDGIEINLPKGAFYLFPNVSAFYGNQYRGHRIQGSMDFCDYLLDEARVALVPGAAFGEDACVRISYAASMSDLENAMTRLEAALSKLTIEKHVPV